MSRDLRTLFVSETIQDLIDMIKMTNNKDDLKKSDRQMAYNQARALIELLQCFRIPMRPFTMLIVVRLVFYPIDQ